MKLGEYLAHFPPMLKIIVIQVKSRCLHMHCAESIENTSQNIYTQLEEYKTYS